MNTTDLFNFRFVDRKEERNQFNSFLLSPGNNVLWIKGKRGIGKTEFVNCVMINQTVFQSLVYDIKIQNTSVDILSNLIIELQKYCKLDFMSLVRSKYKKFYDKSHKIIKDITPDLFPKISSIASAILNAGNYVITNKDQKKEPIIILFDYLETILRDTKLFFCIDNYSRCDIATSTIIAKITKKFLDNPNFRACIITTDEDLKDDIKEEIFYSLPFISIELLKFKEHDYFYQILEQNFELSAFSNDDFKYIWHKCDGNPKKLSTLVCKLLEKQGITIYQDRKASIHKGILFDLLQMEHIKFQDTDFSSSQKWVIFTYLCLGNDVPLEQLSGLALYISKRNFLYNSFDNNVLNKSLLELVERKIFLFDSNNIIRHQHDEDYIELLDIFNDSQLKGLFSQLAYEYILSINENEKYQYLICQNARNALITGWEIMNYNFGRQLFNLRQYYDAQKIFSYLENSLYKLFPIQIMKIAVCSY